MDDLPDLRELITPPTLTLRIGGVAYEVEACSALNGAKIQVFRADLVAFNNGDTERPMPSNDEFWDMTLAGVRQQMYDGGVRAAEITRSAWTAFYWHLDLPEAAQKHWTGEAGKATAPETTKTPVKKPRPTKKPTRSRGTAGAHATR